MPSLHDLTARRARLLVLDASSLNVQVGWLVRGEAPQWAAAEGEAGITLFENLEKIGASPALADAFAFCDGPGSILGIRSAAMAIRTWNVLQPRPVYRFTSLALLAFALNQPDASLIADARRETWHRYRLGHGLDRVPASELSGPLFMPANFRHWSAMPEGVDTLPYLLSDLFPRIAAENLFEPSEEPDAFLHQEPTYKIWEPQIHRAP